MNEIELTLNGKKIQAAVFSRYAADRFCEGTGMFFCETWL